MQASDPKKMGQNIFLCKKMVPKNGWGAFGDSLTQAEIESLPTEEDIKGYRPKGFVDGYAFVFEIATRNSYRVLSYNNIPCGCEQPDCKKMGAFLYFLEREFDFDYCWPNCWKTGQPGPLQPN